MSYRGLKRLLGETSLERKCRWLLAIGILTLMFISFYIYARQTEELAYDQLEHTGRALMSTIVARIHARGELRVGIEEFQRQTEEKWPEKLKGYQYWLIKPNSTRPENQPSAEDLSLLTSFKNDPAASESHRTAPAERAYIYYGAIRAYPSCVGCHNSPESMGKYFGGFSPASAAMAEPGLRAGDLMGVVRVQLSTEFIESGFHTNRAILIAFAVGTTILILAGSYAVIRYVIVKPLKHLKSVADAIAAGQLNVRSEIQTADEFEDLSDAFNRMLRNLTTMQERNRGLIGDLDRKVDELARLNMALFESNRLKGDFLSTMSHELRTPLNAIIGFSEVLISADNLSDKQQRYAGNIMSGGQQLLSLINDILELAKMEAGKMRLHPAALDPAELLERSCALYRPAAEKKSVELRVQADPDVQNVVQDAGKLTQIINNLVSNAIKFTPEGGRVTATATVLSGRLVVKIIDTGVGIPPEEQSLVFDKFRQASNPLTREQGGTGLGLSIVRELAKLLGGDVTLESELGRGSTFTVDIAADLGASPAGAAGGSWELPEPGAGVYANPP